MRSKMHREQRTASPVAVVEVLRESKSNQLQGALNSGARLYPNLALLIEGRGPYAQAAVPG